MQFKARMPTSCGIAGKALEGRFDEGRAWKRPFSQPIVEIRSFDRIYGVEWEVTRKRKECVIC